MLQLGVLYILFIYLIAIAQFAEINSTCKTPDNDEGQCVLVPDCPPLLLRYREPQNSSEVELVKKSLCGVDEFELVCCRLADIERENNQVSLNTNPTSAVVDIERLFGESLPDRTVCGKTTVDVINHPNQFPWLVGLAYNTTSPGNFTTIAIRCAGSLINKRFVLTVASCIHGNDHEKTELFEAVLGDWNRQEHPDYCDQDNKDCRHVQHLPVDRIIPHPFYNRDKQFNNIALARLGSDVAFSDHIRPICLPLQHLQPFRKESAQPSYALNYLSQVYRRSTMSLSGCLSSLYQDVEHKKKMELCARSFKTMLCRGFGGNSLMQLLENPQSSNWILAGVSTYDAYLCTGRPDEVFTLVFPYIKWVLKTISVEV